MLCIGVCAKEIHVCGEASAIELIKDLALSAGDEVEVVKYNRLTSLKVLDKSVGEQQLIKFCMSLLTGLFEICKIFETRGPATVESIGLDEQLKWADVCPNCNCKLSKALLQS